MAEFPFGYTVKPGDTTSLGLLEQRPRLHWPAQPGKLYTVMFFDHDSQSTIRCSVSSRDSSEGYPKVRNQGEGPY